MTEAFKLDDLYKYKLQSIMLHMALETQRVETLKQQIKICEIEINKYKNNLACWQEEYSKILNEKGLNISDVEIDAETGQVTILNGK